MREEREIAEGLEQSDTALIAFEDCLLPLESEGRETFRVDFRVEAGDFLLVMTGDAAHELALADAARGLVEPLEGCVRFLGNDWLDLGNEVADACRGRIGSTLSDHDWLPYLTLLDNILLPHLYHSRRSQEELSAEAAEWARRFGFPGAPDDLPGVTLREDRRRASFLRAFLGDPLVVMIEQQRGPLPPRMEVELFNAIAEVRQRGGALIWLTRDASLFGNRLVPAGRRLRLIGSELRELEAA